MCRAASIAQVCRREPVEERERSQSRGERDEHARQDRVTEEDAAEAGHEERVEREERGRAGRPGVAFFGDLQEPVAVPAGPDVDPGPEVVQAPAVPLAAASVQCSVEADHNDHGQQPDRSAAPEKHTKRGRDAARVVRHGMTLDGRAPARPARRAEIGARVRGTGPWMPNVGSPMATIAA